MLFDIQIHWNVSDEHGWQTDGPTIHETWAAMEKLVDLVSDVPYQSQHQILCYLLFDCDISCLLYMQQSLGIAIDAGSQ